ncbi:MAG: VWA domain-containing protein [Richelia sp. RM2_1_2]|nr:VWA domain-containing protein [Richelia sp. RM2_1_2]
MKATLLILLLFFPVFSSYEESKGTGCLQLDIMVLVDMSQSVSGHESFVKDAVGAFVNRFEFAEEGIKMGMVRFASDAYLITELTSNKTLFHRGMFTISDADGLTNMCDAFTIAANEFIKHGRMGVRKIAIIISDGQPTAGGNALEAAQVMKILGTTVCGIFIDAHMGQKEFLREISSEYCYVESDYENLVNELEKMDICL